MIGIAQPVLGAIVILTIAVAFSKNPRAINWTTVAWGLSLQIVFALIVLKTTVGQGGVNFIQNAILGPLADKRFSTINRIETAIGRNAAKPNLNAEGLRTCTLNQ